MTGKKSVPVIAILSAVLLYAGQQQSTARFLKIKEPVLNQESGNHLLLSLDNLYEMIRLDELQDAAGDLEIINTDGETVARLGKVKNGEIKWTFRVVNDQWLLVEFKENDYRKILENVQSNPGESGYLLQLVTKDIKIPDGRFVIRDADKRYQQKELNYLRFYHLTFSEVPDLAVEMKFPIHIQNGQDITDEIEVSVKNKGASPAEEVQVELLLSAQSQLPPTPIPSVTVFSPDAPLRLGRVTLKQLDPGESRKISFTDSITIPFDVPPGKYYMAVVADPEGKLKEYARLDNSILGLTLLAFPKLQKLEVGLNQAQLVFEPENYKLTIESQGDVISDGKDWRKCRMRPYIFQLRHANWPDYHWEINTVDRGVWEVRGAQFCQTGGRGRELPTRIEVDGGSRFTQPRRVIIPLNDLMLHFFGDQGRMQLTAYGSPIQHGPAWRICRLKPSVYRFRTTLWPDFFWEIDLFEKSGSRVSGVDFQHEGGEHQPMDVILKTEYAPGE